MPGSFFFVVLIVTQMNFTKSKLSGLILLVYLMVEFLISFNTEGEEDPNSASDRISGLTTKVLLILFLSWQIQNKSLQRFIQFAQQTNLVKRL